MKDHLISVVLPVYNQADHIAGVVAEYTAGLSRLPCAYELLLVVNGCRDQSAVVCRRLAEQDPRVRALELDRGGWGRAVRHGLLEARGDLLCYTNSARTGGEHLLLLLLYALAHPDTVIKANRKIRDNWRRRVGSLLYNLQCRSLFDLAYWDINGTPKVFPRAFGRLLGLTRDDDLIDAEFNWVCRREGYPVLEVPVLSTRRHGGKTTTTLRSAVRLYWGAYQLWRSTRKAA